MTKFILIDQVMPLDFDGKTYYVIWKEANSRQELIDWALSQSMTENEYKIKEITPL